jgi:hypothetical protein
MSIAEAGTAIKNAASIAASLVVCIWSSRRSSGSGR